MSNPVRGVIFDMDGTLIDSNDAHAQTWTMALNEFGYPVTVEVLRPLIGLGGDKLVPRLTGRTVESAQGESISERRSALFEEKYMNGIQAFPGSRDLLERIRATGRKVVLASSSGRKHLDRLLELTGLGDSIDSATSASDVEESKPDPDVIEAALGRLGMAAADVVMIGDTPYDIEAAARAGVRTVALRCGGWDNENLTGAIAVYNDPADLLDQFEHSPLAGQI